MSMAVTAADIGSTRTTRARIAAARSARETTAEVWIERRRQELLAVPYFHVVFTLPKELRPIVRRHQKTLYGVLDEGGRPGAHETGGTIPATSADSWGSWPCCTPGRRR